MSIKIRFRNLLKLIGLIEKDKLEELETLSKEVKRLIEIENQNDPIDPDKALNGILWVQMYQVLETIEKMKQSTPNLDWSK